MKKIAYIISNIDKSLGFEWTAVELIKRNINLIFILLNPTGESELEKFLRKNEIKVYNIPYTGKKDIPSALFKTYKILKNETIKIVHTHLFDACLVGLFAARLAGIKKRIITRHHATFHHEYFPRAVYYDKFINNMATQIVAPSSNVKEILVKRECVNENKIEVIYHGFKLEDFYSNDEKKIEWIRKKYFTQKKYPIIGCISRYTEWKGVQYLIPAFKKTLSDYPNAFLILANAKGNYSAEIKKLLSELPKDSFCEIEFENEITSLYKVFDIFVHAPVNTHSEAFGQTYVESLASGIPSVFTLSGIAKEFIENNKNALVVDFKNFEEIKTSICKLLENTQLKDTLIKQGRTDVEQRFSLAQMIDSLEKLYNE